MSQQIKTSRCGFVVIKFQIYSETYLMMRKDSHWKDINFIGGHERSCDRGNLQRTARRELLEEVPFMRGLKRFELRSLTDEVAYGPIFSQSSKCEVKYVLRFFLVVFGDSPKAMLAAAGSRTRNMLFRQREALGPSGYNVSGLVQLLDEMLPGGLESIPYSWSEDLGTAVRGSGLLQVDQRELPLKWKSN